MQYIVGFWNSYAKTHIFDRSEYLKKYEIRLNVFFEIIMKLRKFLTEKPTKTTAENNIKNEM